MDFSKLKEKASNLQKKAKQAADDALKYSAGKLADSKFTLKNISEISEVIQESENKKKKLDSGEEKTFIHQSIIIFCDTKSDFFESLLLGFPVLATKAFSQNVTIKLADIDTEWFKKEEYKIQNFPALVLFENTKVKKVLEGEEKVQKVVKNMSLDINKTIDEL